MKYLIGLLIVAALIYGGKLYLKKPAETKPTAPMTTDETGVKTINVTGANFRFNPKTITVKKGDRVKIVLKSEDMQHDFVIDELGAKTAVAVAGETVETEFAADKAGQFEYYCSVGNHRSQGMVGTLTVTE